MILTNPIYMNKRRKDFKVVIEGLNLPKDTQNRIANEIRRTVLREVASLDLRGDLVVKNMPKGKEFLENIGPTDGIWTKYQEV